MSELGHAGSYLSQRAQAAVRHVTRLYVAALDSTYHDLKLSHEDQTKKEIELLLDMATQIALTNDVSYEDLVYNFISTSVAVYKAAEDY